MEKKQITATVSSIGVEHGKSVLRLAVEEKGRSGVRIVHVDTNLTSFARLAEMGVTVVNK